MRIGLESRLKEFLTGNYTAVQKTRTVRKRLKHFVLKAQGNE